MAGLLVEKSSILRVSAGTPTFSSPGPTCGVSGCSESGGFTRCRNAKGVYWLYDQRFKDLLTYVMTAAPHCRPHGARDDIGEATRSHPGLAWEKRLPTGGSTLARAGAKASVHRIGTGVLFARPRPWVELLFYAFLVGDHNAEVML